MIVTNFRVEGLVGVEAVVVLVYPWWCRIPASPFSRSGHIWLVSYLPTSQASCIGLVGKAA